MTTTNAELVSWLGPWTSDSTPLHHQLSARLRALIVSGQLDVDTKLPAERALGRMLHVSRNTVTAAYRTLIDEGWVETKRGSGARVASGPHAKNRTHQVSATFSGLLAESTTINNEVADLTVRSPAIWPGVASMWAKAGAELELWLGCSDYAPAGDHRFRARLAEHLSSQGLPTNAEELLITTGAQQGLNLVAQLLLGRGDCVVTENHTYPGALDAFMAVGAHVVANNSADSDQQTALFYVISANQNPTGTSMTNRDRAALAAQANERGSYVLDDLSMQDLAPTMSSPAVRPESMSLHVSSDRLLTIGSFSKLFWTGLRLGWIRADRHLIERLTAMKTTADLGASVPSQALGFHLLDHHDEALKWRSEQLTHATTIVTAALAQNAPSWQFNPNQGGMYFWIELPTEVALEFTQFALRHNVIFVPGQLFHPEGLGNRYIRVSLATPPDQLEVGMERLVDAWQAFETLEKA